MRRLLIGPTGEVRPIAMHPQSGPVVATIDEEGLVEPRPLREVAEEVVLADGARAYAAAAGDRGCGAVSSHVVAGLLRQAREEGKEEGRALA